MKHLQGALLPEVTWKVLLHDLAAVGHVTL